MKLNRKKAGITLFELMCALVVLTIIAVLVYLKFGNMWKDAHIKVAVADAHNRIKELAEGYEQYERKHNRKPGHYFDTRDDNGEWLTPNYPVRTGAQTVHRDPEGIVKAPIIPPKLKNRNGSNVMYDFQMLRGDIPVNGVRNRGSGSIAGTGESDGYIRLRMARGDETAIKACKLYNELYTNIGYDYPTGYSPTCGTNLSCCMYHAGQGNLMIVWPLYVY